MTSMEIKIIIFIIIIVIIIIYYYAQGHCTAFLIFPLTQIISQFSEDFYYPSPQEEKNPQYMFL